jgi:DnaJ-class molecular chaperone
MDSESETSVETYYDILNISSNASQEVIKKAYQEMVKQFHPDSLAYWANMEIAPEWIKKETNDKTKKIIEAYQVLRDPKKRKEYDESIER